MSTTVGIIAYHRPATLERLLDQIVAAQHDVIVVNVEDDPGVAAIALDRNVCVVPVANRGYGAAVNVIARRARGDVVVFMNDDVDASDAHISVLADWVRTHRSDVALPAIRNSRGSIEPTVLALPTPWRLAVEWALAPDDPVRGLNGRVRVEKWRRPERPEIVDAGTAAVVAVRTEVLSATPLDEDYFLYWEELDWFWRLRVAGCSTMLLPQVTVTHDGGRDDVRADKSRLLARNALRCVRRTQGRGAAIAAWPVVVLWNLRLVATDSVLGMLGSRARRARVSARAAGLRAALEGWRELR